jgi:hypothetical protein
MVLLSHIREIGAIRRLTGFLFIRGSDTQQRL